MEANPRFKTGAPRGNESPPSSQRNRGSTGRLGLEAVRGDTLSSCSLFGHRARVDVWLCIWWCASV